MNLDVNILVTLLDGRRAAQHARLLEIMAEPRATRDPASALQVIARIAELDDLRTDLIALAGEFVKA